MSDQQITFTADADQDGLRLDRVLADQSETLSRSRIKGLIEAGLAAVDGKTIEDPNFRVKQGSKVILRVPAPTADTPEPQAIPLDIVYEDDHIVIINKPAGLVIHPAPGNPDNTLVNALLAHCGESLKGIGGVKRPGIVHRLDKGTSGLLVAAKTETAHNGLTSQFAVHSITRAYTALVWGVPAPVSGTVSAPIGRSRNNRKKMAMVKSGGKNATTHYALIEAFGLSASLIECRLETGRTHQIRVHMAHRGNSIVGDPLYGRGIRRRKEDRITHAVRTFNRQALHAGVLGFEHPITGKPLRFEAGIPEDFQTLLSAFKNLADGNL